MGMAKKIWTPLLVGVVSFLLFVSLVQFYKTAGCAYEGPAWDLGHILPGLVILGWVSGIGWLWRSNRESDSLARVASAISVALWLLFVVSSAGAGTKPVRCFEIMVNTLPDAASAG
jgi:hypothetical protein